jgi:hypothetical protein
MRSSERRRRTSPRGRRWRALLLLAAVLSLLGAGGSVRVAAQDAAAATTGEDLFGAYSLDARGLGVQATYELVGLLPGGSKVLDLTVPETVARFGSGPTGYGLASIAYPGGLIVNLGSLLAQTGADASQIPDYPIKAEAFYPTGPTESSQSVAAGADERVTSGDLGVEAIGTFPAIDAPPAIKVGSIRSASRSSIEDGKAVARSRVELGNIAILGGVVTIDSLVTDVVAAHDGTAGAADGGTQATGVKFLGLAANLTEDGLVLAEAPPVSGPAAGLGDALDALLKPLQDITAPVRALLEDVLSQAVPSLTDPLAAAGLEIKLLSAEESASTVGAAGRTSSGLSITLSYEGREQQALVDLINSIPAELKPSLGPIPNPVVFLAENHIIGLTLGHASVTALASPPFDPDGGLTDPPLPSGDLVPGTFEPGTLPSPSFATPTPSLPGPAVLGTDEVSALGAALPAVAVILLLLASPLLGLGSTRLADNVLSTVATSCPSGLDQPRPPSRPT